MNENNKKYMSTKKQPTKTNARTTSTKASTKKSSVTQKKKELVHASPEQSFWVMDGQILTNLIELRDALATMSDDVFMHHVTKDRNDFADWIETVLEDAEIAHALRKSKKSNTSRDVIVQKLRFYSI